MKNQAATTWQLSILPLAEKRKIIMDKNNVGIQRPETNWLRTTGRNFGVAGALLLTACGPADKKTTTAAPVPRPSVDTATPSAPATVPARGCRWANKEGQRQPPVSTNPVTVRVDGSCDPNPAAPIGLYSVAEQVGQPLTTVKTNDELTVRCYVANAEPIQDARDRLKEGDQFIASSPVWVEVTAPNGTTGKVSETWVGFPGIKTLSGHRVPECPTRPTPGATNTR